MFIMLKINVTADLRSLGKSISSFKMSGSPRSSGEVVTCVALSTDHLAYNPSVDPSAYHDNMGDLPRWIDKADIDSSAMLGAFLGYANKASPEERRDLLLLPMVNHVPPEFMVIAGNKVMLPKAVQPAGMIAVQCSTEGCLRCREKKGGYKFRWVARRWLDGYVAAARPGTWRPN